MGNMGWMTRLGSVFGAVGAFLLTYDPPGPGEHLGDPLKSIGTILAAAAAILVPFGLRRSNAKLMTKIDTIETKLNGEAATKKK